MFQSENNMLSSKIRISLRSRKILESSKRHKSFYEKYSSVVLKVLKTPSFQNFMNWMLRKESIDANSIENIHVMFFPFRKDNGKPLAGKYSKDEICIYPKRLEFCRKLIGKYGKKKVYSYLKNRARATLIHEFLHVKYSSDEEKVRQLTKEYFEIFSKNQNHQSENGCGLLKFR